MIRFAEVGWANLDNEHPVNVPHTTLLPPSVEVSQAKQKLKEPREAAAALPRRHTRSMTTDAARKAVFNTSELLENIVSFLPPRDILTKVPRLSRQWKTAVETSPTVRNKLWMASCKASAVQSIGFTGEHMPGDPTWRQVARPMYSCDLTLNSALFNKGFCVEESQAFRLGLLSSQNVNNDGVAWTFPSILFHCYFNGSFQQNSPAFSPSWRSMHLTSPPITMGMLELHLNPSAFHGPDDVYLHLTDNTGITLGLLYDTIFATFKAQFGATMAFGEFQHFWASLHFVSASASLGTSILIPE
jgi:hypothetical protein